MRLDCQTTERGSDEKIGIINDNIKILSVFLLQIDLWTKHYNISLNEHLGEIVDLGETRQILGNKFVLGKARLLPPQIAQVCMLLADENTISAPDSNHSQDAISTPNSTPVSDSTTSNSINRLRTPLFTVDEMISAFNKIQSQKENA